MLDITLLCEGASNVDEQETSINIDYRAKRATIYSSRPQVIKLLTGWLHTYREETECLVYDNQGIEISVPASWIRLQPPVQRSETWKQGARERLAAAREKRWKKEQE